MKRLLVVVIAILATLLPTLRAQYIFVTGGSSVYRYDLDGSNSTEIVSGLSSPQGLAVSGSTLFVLSTGGGGSIRSYNLDGTGGTTLVSSGLGSAQSIAASDSNLFVTNFVGAGGGSILKYNLNGTGGSTLVPGLTSPFGIATQGSDIFVSGNGQISQFNRDTGATGFATAASGNLLGVAASGSHLFVTLNGNPLYDFHSGSGALQNTFSDSVGADAYGVAADGTYVYFTNYTGNSVGRYMLDGTAGSLSFITGVTNPLGIAISTSAIPEPTTYAAILGLLALGAGGVRESRRRKRAS
jgi:hypothetical protein